MSCSPVVMEKECNLRNRLEKKAVQHKRCWSCENEIILAKNNGGYVEWDE